MNTKVISLVLIPVILLLFYWLFAGIKGPMDEQKRIAQVEKDIIEKLKFVRDLQIAYHSQNGKYAGKWDKLIDFAKNGDFVITQRKEFEEGSADKIRVVIDTLGRVPVRDSLLKKYPKFKVDEIPLIPHTKGKKFSLYAGSVENGNVVVSVFEVKDIYPINNSRGAEFNEKGEPYSVPTLIKYFENKLAKIRTDVTERQRKMKGAADSDKASLQKEIDEMSKYVNLYDKRIQQLKEKPLKVGSREEASTGGNWE